MRENTYLYNVQVSLSDVFTKITINSTEPLNITEFSNTIEISKLTYNYSTNDLNLYYI